MRSLYSATLISLLGLVGGASQVASADTVTYAGYPPPGGVTYTKVSGSGAIQSGGITHEYSNFNSSAYTNLYYVIDTVAGAPYLEQTGTNYTDTLTYDPSRSNLTGGVLVFDGTGTVNSAEFGNESYFGELQVTITNAATSAPLSLDSPSLHTGIPAADGGALNVTGPYDVNLQFLMGANSSSLTDAADYYNGLHTPNGDSLDSSVNGGFYYTPVPLPAAGWLLLSGMGGLGALARKKRSA